MQLQDNSRVTIAVVMACYNRRNTTLKCLRSIYNFVPASVELSVFVFDDASSDGTGAAVREQYPQVRIIEGDGKQFWCGGMRAAMAEAAKTSYDFLLWLNDDVELNDQSFALLFTSYERAKTQYGGLNVIIGAIADPISGSLTYSGYRRLSRIHPAKLAKILPDPNRLVECDTMNGNCVLFPAELVRTVGEIDRAYIQTIGDVDYGYRCVDAGARLWLSSKVVGSCPPNTRVLAWQNNGLSFAKRWKILNTPHGQPIRPWVHFMFRFGGPIAIVLLFWNYFKWLAVSLVPLRLRPTYNT